MKLIQYRENNPPLLIGTLDHQGIGLIIIRRVIEPTLATMIFQVFFRRTN